MGFSLFLFSFLLLITLFQSHTVRGNAEARALMDLKASLDPDNWFLSSWTVSGDPCDGSFEGVGCNEKGQVANISLQGKGLAGKLSQVVGDLKHLTGLYLHYNSLYGEIPREISNLAQLNDLYINVNNLSGQIPPELGSMSSLQVLQLSYNQFTGNIPTELGSLKKLKVLSLQSNRLTGPIPASLGDLRGLLRLDLSFNNIFGSIPIELAEAPLLEVLDVQNNSLSGYVPLALKKLVGGFQYHNNLGLCGAGFPSLKACGDQDNLHPKRPEPFGGDISGLSTKDIPETANINLNCSQTKCSSSSKAPRASVVVGVIIVTVAVSAVGILAFVHYHHQKQKLGSGCDNVSESNVCLNKIKGVHQKNGSPLISLEYSSGWDPFAEGHHFGGDSHEALQSFRFNMEEIEIATQNFSEKKLLGKSNCSAIYKGTLRDGSTVAVKRITKTSCKSEEAEFLKGLHILISLRHENLVRLRGFCSSKRRRECFVIYDFVPNGNLLRYLDMKEGDDLFLEWPARLSIINGIAKGIEYLHNYSVNKAALVHQNISAENVLIGQKFKPLLSESGLHKLLTTDTVFSALKASAAMGYLAPEYTTTGRFTDKSDIYAFGVLVFQILSGKREVNSSMRTAAESCRLHDLVDASLQGRFVEHEAAKLAEVALKCTHEYPEQRPTIAKIVQELGNCTHHL